MPRIEGGPVIAVAGATGAVGQEFLRLFEQRRTAWGELRLLASARSAGKSFEVAGESIVVRELTAEAFDGVDVALFSAGGSISREFGPIAVERGCTVVDNSSAFRMADGVPLVVPEINGDEVASPRAPGIIANPNCSTIIMAVALEPLRRAFGIEHIVVSTYQAASGAGAAAMEELRAQTSDVLAGREPKPDVFPVACAFNVFSHNSTVDPATGLNVEEQKMVDEARKIWSQPELGVNPTCIRVPVLRAHAEAITVTLRDPATETQVREALESGTGVRVIDDRDGNVFPTSLDASGIDDVLVGRIRPDHSGERRGDAYRRFALFAVGDQIRKGAALNALQIAERVLGASVREPRI
ncbi:MAG: aspartate-semialdehyde dehydrogenase [Planctomycetota bacterium]